MRLGVALRAWAASTGSAVTHARGSDMCNEPNVNALRYRISRTVLIVRTATGPKHADPRDERARRTDRP